MSESLGCQRFFETGDGTDTDPRRTSLQDEGPRTGDTEVGLGVGLGRTSLGGPVVPSVPETEPQPRRRNEGENQRFRIGYCDRDLR